MVTKDIKLSATRISTFLRCKQRYWFQYVLHYPKDTDNLSFKAGLLVHEVLEYAGHIWQEKEKFTASDKKKFLTMCDEIAVREGLSDLSILMEARDLIKKRIDSFDIGGKIIGIESRFGFDDSEESVVVTDTGVALIGAFDKLVEVDENTLLVVDYKTSKTAPTASQLKTDLQLSIYDLVASIRYPQYRNIILALDLLKHDLSYTYRTLEERRDFSDYLTVLYNQMLALNEASVFAQVNLFCGWCDFKNYCTEYEKTYKKTNYEFGKILTLNDDELIGEWNNVRNIQKILEARERELALVLTEKIKEQGNLKTNDGEEVYIRQNSRKNYDLQTVYTNVPAEDFVNLVSLNKSAVERYIENNVAVKSRIEQAATINFTTPFLAVRKSKK